MIIVAEYIALNGQSRGQDGSTHTDCACDASDLLSQQVSIAENTRGGLLLFDKDGAQRLTDRIALRPSRVVAVDGSVPPIARRPIDE